jgi:hypothetical protein
MAEHTYHVTEIVGTSTNGVDAAIRNGIHSMTADRLTADWFEVDTIRGYIESPEVQHYQVQMKVGQRRE